jgi:uncharacterized coiled-coil protein SlyX
VLGSLLPGTDKNIINSLEAYIAYQKRLISKLSKEVQQQKNMVKELKAYINS